MKKLEGYYVGAEFPDYYGKEIEIKDDQTDKNFPCYKIKFVGDNEWIGNIDDEDWQLKNPNE